MTNFPSMPNPQQPYNAPGAAQPQQPQPAAYPGAGFQAPQQGGAHAGYGQPAAGAYGAAGYGAGAYGAPGQPSPYPAMAQPGGFGGPGAPGYQGVNTPAKSFVAAILLQIFLGGFGAADFYMGYKKIGFIKVGLFALYVVVFFATSANFIINPSNEAAAGFGVGMLVSSLIGVGLGIWALVTLILIAARKSMYATDSMGRALA